MTINRDNYELYFIDFIDGTLTPSRVEELHQFLTSNPDLSSELDGLEQTVLDPQRETYCNKHSVYKDTSYCGITNRLHYLSIVNLENDITVAEHTELEQKLAQSGANVKEFALFQKAKLVPDTSIRYANKVRLKRYAYAGLTYRQLVAFSSSAAAVIVLLFGLSLFMPNKADYTAESMAVNREPKTENAYLSNLITIKEPSLPIPKVEVKALAQPKYLVINSNINVTKEVVISSEPTHAKPDLSIKKLSSISVTSIPYITDNQFIINSDELLALGQNSSVNVSQPISSTKVVGVFELVQMGVDKLSDLSEKNISLAKETDTNGYIKRINFNSPFFALSVPVKKDGKN